MPQYYQIENGGMEPETIMKNKAIHVVKTVSFISFMTDLILLLDSSSK